VHADREAGEAVLLDENIEVVDTGPRRELDVRAFVSERTE
jgi:hypothetical protein